MVSIVPPNALGAAAVAELRRHGVDTSGVVDGPGRMGLYFLTPGAVSRPSAVLYDRAGSAFALGGADGDRLARTRCAALVGCICRASRRRSASARRRPTSAPPTPRSSSASPYRSTATIASSSGPRRAATRGGSCAPCSRPRSSRSSTIATSRSSLGVELEGDALERRRGAAAAAFAAFPRLETICSTIREVDSAQRQRLGGVMFTRERELVSRTYSLDGIVDRVGAGDAFAAGILHGRIAGLADQDTLELGVAAAALKHSIRGDFNLVDLRDVEQLVAAKGLDIRR